MWQVVTISGGRGGGEVWRMRLGVFTAGVRGKQDNFGLTFNTAMTTPVKQYIDLSVKKTKHLLQ